jgi:hypothetical protein
MDVDFGALDRDWIVCGSRTTVWARGTQKLRGQLRNSLIWIRILLYLASSNVCATDAGMGCCVVALRWFRRSLIRLLGLPRLLTLYLELYSFVLHRLARRIRLQNFAYALQNDMSSSSNCSGGAPKKVGRAQQTLGKPQNSCIGEKSSKHASSTASSTTSPSTSSYTSHARPLSSLRLNPPMPHSRSKTTSQADLVGQGKRLSLQFPIQPATGASSPGTNSPRSRPSSWVAPAKILSPESENPPSDAEFLAVLAAQERYVLELKEELTKAEADLKTLKKHYALHEANKRRNDVRKVAQLQPVNTLIDITPDNEKEDEDGSSSTWVQKEMERRKALLANTKSSQRKVFSGSRHLRTLSLLSPDKTHAPSFPQPLDLHEDEPATKQPEPAPRSSTSSDRTKQLIDINERYDGSGLPTIQKEQLIRAGTQMANDFKNGFFTFIDDIRQATVGDEAVNGHDEEMGLGAGDLLIKGARKPSNTRPALNRSASSKKSSQRQGSIGDDFWKENGLSEPKTSTMPSKKTHTNKPAQTPQKQTQKVVDEEEEWDNWETPNDTFGAKPAEVQDSSDESDEAFSPGPGSSRTSTRYHSKRHDSKASSLTTISSTGDDVGRDSKRNSIPWPDLVKLSPNNLKRTASHLMKEWEKQLTPPPESRNSSHSHGDYIGRSDSSSLI